jgi:hypothetical protein
MQQMMEVVVNPANIQKVMTAGVSAMALVFGAQMFNRSMRSEVAPDFLTRRVFLARDEDWIDALFELQKQLGCVSSFKNFANVFEGICDCADWFCGVQYLIARNEQTSSRVRLEIQQKMAHMDNLLVQVIKHDFHIAKLGADICNSIDTIQNLAKDLAHNANLEIRFRLL